MPAFMKRDMKRIGLRLARPGAFVEPADHQRIDRLEPGFERAPDRIRDWSPVPPKGFHRGAGDERREAPPATAACIDIERAPRWRRQASEERPRRPVARIATIELLPRLPFSSRPRASKHEDRCPRRAATIGTIICPLKADSAVHGFSAILDRVRSNAPRQPSIRSCDRRCEPERLSRVRRRKFVDAAIEIRAQTSVMSGRPVATAQRDQIYRFGRSADMLAIHAGPEQRMLEKRHDRDRIARRERPCEASVAKQ
jgi:hypothetical protein